MYLLRAKYHFKLSSISSYEGGGIFVTQAGPVGIFSHTEVFSSNYNTLRQVFKSTINRLDNETHVHKGSCKIHTWPWQACLINQA
ncbi:hypothetical protein Ahy_A05g025535 [Arachis hypogaea]|uniref:Uncharacterized protein n=1 Tax=Arachis hypogaea TaxID=3818 RepID=A0A445D8Y2_ARAHY|nr:hypothetical protein Ahy_A05g025535 [Arachis hypogaea]